MSTLTAAPVDERTTLASLARYETLRLAKHPVFVLGMLLFVALTVTAPFAAYPDAGYDTAGNRETTLDFPVLPAFALGLFGLIALNRLTSSSGRSGEVLTAAPVPASRRTLALCAAALLPAAIALVGTAYMHVFYVTNPPVQAENWGEFSQAELVAINLGGVLAALGGPLLGVLVARWWRWPTAAAVTSVVLILWSMTSLVPDKNLLLTVHHLAAPFTLVASNGEDYSWHMGGSWLWRVPYLAGLCALAVVGACAHGTEGAERSRWVRRALVAGGVALGCLLLGVLTGPDGYYSWRS